MAFFAPLVEPLLAHRWRVAGELVINSLLACGTVLSVALFQRILANIEAGVPYSANYPVLAAIAVMVTLPGVIRLVFYPNEPRLFVMLNQYLTRKYLSRFVVMDNEVVAHMGTGKLLTAMKEGIDVWTDALWQLYYNAVPQVVAYFLSVALIARIEPWLLVPVAVFTVFEAIFIWWTNARTHRYRVGVRKIQESVMRRWIRVIMEKFPILKYDRIDHEIQAIDELWEENYDMAGRKKGLYLGILKVGSEVILDLAKVVFFFVIGYFGWAAELSVGEIAIVLVLANFLSRYATRANDYYRAFSSVSSKIERTIDFYENTPIMGGLDEGAEFRYARGDISLRDVTFSYSGRSRRVFEGLSLDIAGSRRTALVGASGVGKSTLMKLVLRFVKPEAGSVSVDGQDLSGVSLRSYFRAIGYLPQEPALFDGTVRDNLLCALPPDSEPTAERLEEALRRAECAFALMLPQGLDTEIGEKWIRLSGGERQRLAIARLFLQDPSFVMLDEPTSALDSVSEAAVTRALGALFAGRTVIVIAHRLQTVKECDEILLLGPEGVAARGTHAELMASSPDYATMVDLQSGMLRG